jgi:DNA repair protein RecN (Recombination protein N)
MSLKRIVLRDFVIVSELELDLNAGFTVLTGETGAGKSILIDALQLALGSRTDAGVVREGAARADISAEFATPSSMGSWLDESGFEQSESLLLRRTIDTQGKSRAWINGSPATATQLREAAEFLVEIHGQHAWQSLMRPGAIRQLLDDYSQLDTSEMRRRWAQWRSSLQSLHEARSAQDSLQQERERLAWQIGELDKLSPGAHEWEELNASHARLANAHTLLETSQVVSDLLESDDSGITGRLAKAIDLLRNQEQIEPEFKALVDVLCSCLAQAEDTAHSLHGWMRNTDLDPDRLAELDARVSAWMSLARRFKRPAQDLPALLASWKSEMGRLDAASDLAALESHERQALAAFMAEAERISRSRRQAAPKLAIAITQAMQGLGMQGGCFEVALDRLEAPAAHGLEEVAFLVSGHPGSTPRPIGKVASGGELSRIALAISVTTSELGSAETLVFDEVDSGVGGAVAETVGRLMKQLGRNRQVLAVTHLPQVAACADQHLVVSKRTDGEHTSSEVHSVSGEQRVAEVARMLGGERLSGTTLAHAKEMLGHGVGNT